jgi:hypothetical protein
MIHSRTNKNVDVIIKVQPSRFRKILSDIRALNALEVDGFIDRMCKDYNYFSFTSFDIGDKNSNKYTVVKNYEVSDFVKKCRNCDCHNKEGRSVNGKTGVCFYKEDIANNYTTEIPKTIRL